MLTKDELTDRINKIFDVAKDSVEGFEEYSNAVMDTKKDILELLDQIRETADDTAKALLELNHNDVQATLEKLATTADEAYNKLNDEVN